MTNISVYHGSKNHFTEFDFDVIGLNGTSEGKGFYFTDKKEVALSYARGDGYVYHVTLNSKKPMYAYRRTISRDDLKRLMDVLEERTEYYSNWGDISYEGYAKVVNAALDAFEDYDDDVDIISCLANECGSVEMVNQAVYETLGYDLIIDNQPKWEREQTIYVALVKDIIDIHEVEIMANEVL